VKLVDERPGPLEVDAAMAARTACEAVFVQGRELADVRGLEVAAINGRLAGFERAEFRVDTSRRSVEVTVPGWRPRTAVHVGDQGCVVLPFGVDGPGFTPRPVRGTRPEPPGDGAGPGAWSDTVAEPATDAVAEALAVVVRGGGVRGIVVVRGGRIVGEAYADGWGPRRPSPSWSMTKTLTALVTGAAVHAGADIDPFAPVPIPAWRHDARSEIRLIDSLRMASGLDGAALAGGVEAPRSFDEPGYWSPANIHDWPYLDSVDTFALAENQPAPSRLPGTHWSYKNCDPITVGRVTHDALAARGIDPLAFPYRLLEAIGAYDTVWSADRRGHYVASALTQSTPRDWARIGLLMLRDGTCDGHRLLPDGWISLLTEPSPANPGYGGLTWLNTEKHYPALPADTCFAEGAFGQATFVVPSHDTVIATMGFAPTTPPADTAAALLTALT
jgi:CubicO group peptidase (beta-lactamase class C family)